MARIKKCCVPGCEDTLSTRHRFPVYEEKVYDVWISRINDEKLKLKHPLEVYKFPYVVCGRHFAPICKIDNSKQQKKYSLPTLHLPGFNDDMGEGSNFLFPEVNYESNVCNVSGSRLCKTVQTTVFEASSSSLEPENIENINSSNHVELDVVVQPLLTPEKLPTNSSHEEGSSKGKTLPTTASEASSFSRDFPSGMAVELLEPENIEKPNNSKNIDLDLGVQPLLSPEKLPAYSLRDQGSTKGVFHGGTSLLKSVNVRRANQLTPKAALLYKTAAKLKRQTRKITKCNLSFSKRLKMAEHFTKQDCFQHIAEHVNTMTLKFIKSQVNIQKLKPRGRRFTLDDKLLALSLYKQGSKGYRLLSRYFALPSRKTLTKLLGTIPLTTGLNKRIMENLQKTVSKMNQLDRHCCLLFDEMALEPGIQYSEKVDKIIGFEDFGSNGRRQKLADHVLVFMVRGIRKKWKQPVAFMFCESTTKTCILSSLIKDVIRNVRQTGLTVIATVCDQSSTNQAAINSLLEETRREYVKQGVENRNQGFILDEEEVVPLYDVPHLLKCVRNHLLVKDLEFKWKAGVQRASWKHVVQFYMLDRGDADLRMCPKLTDEHVLPEKIKKMKVSYCAQVFSQRVSCLMRRFAEDGKYSPELEPAAADTADLLLFMDKVFDSLNGCSLHPRNGKTLRCAVTSQSLHKDFWVEAIKVFGTFKFVDDKGKNYVPPTLNNWLFTIRGFKYLWEKLNSRGFKFLCLRNFNQDPVENFFCCVRSQGVRNINPTCSSFVSSFKTLLLNNFLSPHSIGANCEEDSTEGALNTLRDLVSEKYDAPTDTLYCLEVGNVNVNSEASVVNCTSQNEISTAVHAYVSGYMIRKFLKQTGNCKRCYELLSSKVENPEHFIIATRAYNPSSLCYPKTQFTKTFRQVASVMFQYLPEIGHCDGLSKLMLAKALDSVDMNYMVCSQHNLRKMFVKLCFRVAVHTWCKNVNRILAGKYESRLKRGLSDFSDPVKKLAHEKCIKRIPYFIKICM